MTTGSVFRGWWVLAGVFTVMLAGSGFAFYAQGVFLDALVREQGFSVGLAGAGTGFFFLVSGVSGYYAGGLMSRFDIRAVMTAGAAVAAVGIAAMGQIRTGWQMFVVFFVFGAGYALAGLVPTTSLVTRWFHRRRSVALAIASTGLSLGGIAITPVLAQLIDGRTLVTMAPWLALAYLAAVVPVTWLLVRPSPEALGLYPDGAPPPAEGAPAPEPDGVPFDEAVRSPFFRALAVAFMLVMSAQVGALQHVFKLTRDRVDVDAASVALIVVTLTSVLARLGGGWAATRMSLATLTSILIVVQSVGIAVIGVASSMLVILLGCVILGSAMGNLLMLHPLLLAEAFGVRDYPRIYGLAALTMVVGVGTGPVVVGVVRDAADGYTAAFLIMGVIALLGLVAFRWAAANQATPLGELALKRA